jgi:hypothetical protein
MKIMVRSMWFVVILVILIFSLTACIDNISTLNASKAIDTISTSLKKMGGTVFYYTLLPGDLDEMSFPQQDIEGDKLVLGGTFTLARGETLDGNLFIVGGTARLEKDSVVEKNVMVMGGTLSVEGIIEGDVNLVGGLVTLVEGSVVGGDVNALGGNLLRDEGARVDGKVNTDIPGMFPFVLPGRIQIPNWGEWSLIQPGDLRVPRFDIALNPFWDGIWLLFRSFLWAAMAVLVVLFLPKYSERASEAAFSQPLIAGGLGCLTVLVVPLILVLLAITICGIPVSVIGVILLSIAWAYGVIVIGMEVGKRLAQLVKQDWATPVSACVGTFFLTLVVNSIGALLPCIGWLAPGIVGVVGLGAVVLTRFGTQNYPPEFQPQLETNSKLQPLVTTTSQTPSENEVDHELEGNLETENQGSTKRKRISKSK